MHGRRRKPGRSPPDCSIHTTMRLALLIPALLGLGVSTWAADAPAPLNILILHTDDWRHDTLRCAGDAVVKTPTLDRLAAEGTRFTHACVTTSICGVSRASLLTGQWMSRHGNKGFAMFKTPWAETFPGLLRAKGYWVGHVGKWHCGKFPQEEFDFEELFDLRADPFEERNLAADPAQAAQLTELRNRFATLQAEAK